MIDSKRRKWAFAVDREVGSRRYVRDKPHCLFFHTCTAMQRWFSPQFTVTILVIAHCVWTCVPAAIGCGAIGVPCRSNQCCCSLSNSLDPNEQDSCCQQSSADHKCGCSDHHVPVGNLGVSGSDELRSQDIWQCNRLVLPPFGAHSLGQCNRFSFLGYCSMDTCFRAILCIWQV